MQGTFPGSFEKGKIRCNNIGGMIYLNKNYDLIEAIWTTVQIEPFPLKWKVISGSIKPRQWVSVQEIGWEEYLVRIIPSPFLINVEFYGCGTCGHIETMWKLGKNTLPLQSKSNRCVNHVGNTNSGMDRIRYRLDKMAKFGSQPDLEKSMLNRITHPNGGKQ